MKCKFKQALERLMRNLYRNLSLYIVILCVNNSQNGLYLGVFNIQTAVDGNFFAQHVTDIATLNYI